MKLLLVNAHSALNLGDEAIMATTLALLRRAFPDAEIALAANDPASWAHTGVDVLPSLTSWAVHGPRGRWTLSIPKLMVGLLVLVAGLILTRLRLPWLPGTFDQRRLLRAYAEADVVLAVGGGNYYAYRPLNFGLLWALLGLIYPLLLGKRLAMLPQSVGPVSGRFQRWLLRWTLRRFALVCARERETQVFLHEIGVRSELVPDLAFGLAEPPSAGAMDSTPQRRIGISVMDRGAQALGFGGQQRYEQALIDAAEALSREDGCAIVLVAQCSGPTAHQDDRPVTARIAAALRERGVDAALIPPPQTGAEVRAIYAGLDAVIASRMHTGVFALSAGVPAALIAYQPKSLGMTRLFGLERACFSIDAVDGPALAAAVRELLDGGPALRERLGAQAADFYAQVWRLVPLLQKAAGRE